MSREHSVHVHVTADEDYFFASLAAEWLQAILERKKIQPYNEQFVLRLTIDRLDTEDPQDDRQHEEAEE